MSDTPSPLLARLQKLYDDDTATQALASLQRRMQPYPRSDSPQAPLWSEKDAILITYGDSVLLPGQVGLRGLQAFVEDRLQDAISIVHILPFNPYTSDDGFSVSDYTAVREDLGGWDDVSSLGQEVDLMFDLVLNHCSASHKWFEQFLQDEEPGAGFFHVLDPDTDVSGVTRPRTHPLLTAFDTPSGTKHVWTTFSADQVDLNFSNPDCLLAFIDVLLLYARQGARIIRLDAIAFLWKEIGTPCVHLPQTHEVVKLMRDVLDEVAPHCILLTETNVPHLENVSYFGDGDEARMVYQFSLPPLLLHGLLKGSARVLSDWASQLDPPPRGCTFFNFTSSHDGVGMRPLEGLLPDSEVQELADHVMSGGGRVNFRTLPDGSQRPYELNATYFSALRRKDDDDLTHVNRFLLCQIVPMSLQGIPAFYIHCLTSTPNDIEGMERTGHNRTINRKQWDWQELDEHLSAGSEADSTLDTLCVLLKKRASLSALHPDRDQKILNIDEHVFAVERDKGRFLALHNFSHQSLSLPLPKLEHVVYQSPHVQWGNGQLTLPGYGVVWLAQ